MPKAIIGSTIKVEWDESGYDGRGCISVHLPGAAILQMSLTDAETLADALIRMVRMAEEQSSQ